jgi:hypothetical protein
MPPIELVEILPPDVSWGTEGFVRRNPDVIYLVTSTSAFRDAIRTLPGCGARESLKRIASILVHEEWHIRHGNDERGAYEAQLTALAALGDHPGSPLSASVRRAMRVVLDRSRRLAAYSPLLAANR